MSPDPTGIRPATLLGHLRTYLLNQREATFVQDSLNGLRVGDRVRVDGGRLYRD